jgi:D-lactate dehydrogenase
LLDYEQRFEHHLIIKSSDAGITEMRNFLHDFFANEDGAFIECNAEESQGAMLNRFAAAGAALRYYTLNQHRLSDILALDIALPRSTQDWFENLPPSIAKTVDKALYYGHFFCHVLHQDYLIKKEYDANDVKQAMLAELDRRQAKYPAEHNVGHLYKADENLKAHYDRLDPTNTFNPGIGKTPRHYRGCC